jgi:hypothetical protein
MVVNLCTHLETCSLGIGDPLEKDVSAVEHDMLKESPLCVRSLPPYGACFIQVIWPNLSLLPSKCCYRKLSESWL